MELEVRNFNYFGTDISAYFKGWLNKMRNVKKLIIEAFAKTQRAVDHILKCNFVL